MHRIVRPLECIMTGLIDYRDGTITGIWRRVVDLERRQSKSELLRQKLLQASGHHCEPTGECECLQDNVVAKDTVPTIPK